MPPLPNGMFHSSAVKFVNQARWNCRVITPCPWQVGAPIGPQWPAASHMTAGLRSAYMTFRATNWAVWRNGSRHRVMDHRENRPPRVAEIGPKRPGTEWIG